MLSSFFLKSRSRLNPMTYYRVMHVSKVGQEGSRRSVIPDLEPPDTPSLPIKLRPLSGLLYPGRYRQRGIRWQDYLLAGSFALSYRTLCNLTHFYNLPKIYLYTFQVHVNKPCFENSFICFPYINLFLFCVSCFDIFSSFPRINDEGTFWLSLASLTFQQNDFFELKKSVIWLFSFLYLRTL